MSGSAHFDVMQPDHRIDFDRVRLGALAHDLAMNLALRRHVDDEVAADPRLAAEPPARRATGRACRRSAVRPRSSRSRGRRRSRSACLAKAPSATSTWQRPQMPRPPQTEVEVDAERRARPRAGSGRRRTSPRLPEGVKTIAMERQVASCRLLRSGVSRGAHGSSSRPWLASSRARRCLSYSASSRAAAASASASMSSPQAAGSPRRQSAR